MSAQSSDERDVGALYQHLLDGWNQRDVAAYAALFAEDANVIGFDGSQINGRAEIETQIGQIPAVDEDASLRRPVEGHHQADERALS